MYVHTKKDCINTTRIRTTVSAKPVGKKAKSQRVRRFMRAFPRFRALRTAAQKELERKQKDESKRDIWHDCILLLPVSHFRLLNPTLHPYRIGHLYPNTGTLRGLVAIRLGYMPLQGPYVSDTGDITWCTTDYFASPHTSFALWVASGPINKAAPTLAKGGE